MPIFRVQVSAVVIVPPEHVHPVIAPIQSSLHPLLSQGIPSSQVSPGFLFPFPQAKVQTDGLVGLPEVQA